VGLSPSGGTWGMDQVAKAIATTPQFFGGGGRTGERVTCARVKADASKRQNCVSMVCSDETDGPPGANEITGRTASTREGKRNLLALIWEMCGRRVGGKCYLSILYAAPRLGVDPSTVSRWLCDLRDARLIRRTYWGSDRSGLASEYQYIGGVGSSEGSHRRSA